MRPKMRNQVELSQEDLKKLQSIELEMLLEVDRICRKNDIKYSLDGGTLLGAVRHRGFIPWDDDIDVVMLRPEYEKFRAACETGLDRSRFFLQDYKSDPCYIFGYEKLRRKNTAFVRIGQERLKQHGGIFIDIFVYDHVPDNPAIRQIHFLACFCIRKALYSEIGKTAAKSAALRAWYRLISLVPRNFVFKIRDIIAGKCNKKKTKLCRHYTYTYRKHCRYGLPRVCFDDYTELDFEGCKFKAFKNYDYYLSELYGDYMKLPPVEKRVPHLNVSYIKFVEPKEHNDG